LPQEEAGLGMPKDVHYGVSEQAKASRHRLDDARALFNAVRWRGAMYLAGYAIECLLKTKLMRMFDCRHLRELEEELQRRGVLSGQNTVFTHQLEVLLRLTQRIDHLRQDQLMWRMFNIVNRWVPAWRYSADLSSREDAEDFLEAIDKIRHWIESNV
jgi:HEPN domain-containing protein